MAKQGSAGRFIGIRFEKKGEAECEVCTWKYFGVPGTAKTRARAHAIQKKHEVNVYTIDRIRYEGIR